MSRGARCRVVDSLVRIAPRANLTIDLIRHERFGHDQPCLEANAGDRCLHQKMPDRNATACSHQRVDRVNLSRDAFEIDPWAVQNNTRVDRALPPIEHDPPVPEADDLLTKLSPVVGSPALAGLGVSLIVPGTLLDVVA